MQNISSSTSIKSSRTVNSAWNKSDIEILRTEEIRSHMEELEKAFDENSRLKLVFDTAHNTAISLLTNAYTDFPLRPRIPQASSSGPVGLVETAAGGAATLSGFLEGAPIGGVVAASVKYGAQTYAQWSANREILKFDTLFEKGSFEEIERMGHTVARAVSFLINDLSKNNKLKISNPLFRWVGQGKAIIEGRNAESSIATEDMDHAAEYVYKILLGMTKSVHRSEAIEERMLNSIKELCVKEKFDYELADVNSRNTIERTIVIWGFPDSHSKVTTENHFIKDVSYTFKKLQAENNEQKMAIGDLTKRLEALESFIRK